MNRVCALIVFTVSFTLLMIQKSQEVKCLKSYYKQDRVIKLGQFERARSLVDKNDLDYLKLWESILTGRSAPLSKILKEKYKELGLNHVFTPSGFHLTAVLAPFIKIIKSSKYEVIFLLLLGIFLSFLPGLSALKRMILIKAGQNIFGRYGGFALALILDMLWGSFQDHTLSFTYSFLFLGLIYSGAEGLILIIYFFIAQLMIAFFQESAISPLILLFSPLLNLIFSLMMPFLFALAIPLWEWQLSIGLFLLKLAHGAVDISFHLATNFPVIEMNIIGFFMIIILLKRRWRYLIYFILFYSHQLNLDLEKQPGFYQTEFRPQGAMLTSIAKGDKMNVSYTDGKCRMKLVRGFWWENCSPKRRSSRKRLKKLSYPS